MMVTMFGGCVAVFCPAAAAIFYSTHKALSSRSAGWAVHKNNWPMCSL